MWDMQTLPYHLSSSCQIKMPRPKTGLSETTRRDTTFRQMPAVSTGSSAIKSPLRYDRRVKRGIRLQSKRLDQSPQTADDTRNIAALPAANLTGLMLVEPVH